MKKINRLIIIILISIFIFLINTVNNKASAYNWEPKGKTITITGEGWRSEYYCVNHNYEMKDNQKHTFKLTNRVNYYSDDTSDFKRQIGYLFYLASQDTSAIKSTSYDKNKDGTTHRTYIKLNGYGTGQSGGYKRTKYQLVLWKLLLDFSSDNKLCNKGESPLYKTKVGALLPGEWTTEAASLYKKVKDNYKSNTGEKKPCSEHIGLDSSDLQLESLGSNEVDYTDEKYKYLHFKVHSLIGTISEMSIVFKDNKTNTITIAGDSSSKSNIYLYKKSGRKLVAIKAKDIKSNDVVYVRVNNKEGASSIKEIKGKLKCAPNTGWAVNIEKWTNYTGGKQNNLEQSFIRVVVWNNNDVKEDNFKIGVKKGSLEIRKYGVSTWDEATLQGDNTKGLRSSFKIYCVNNKKWVKGNAIGEKVYTDDFSQASIYKPEVNKNQVTIDNLVAGYRYTIYEVDVDNPDYKDSKGIPCIVDVAWAYADETKETNPPKTWRRDDGQTDIIGWFDGEKEIPGFGNVYISYDRTKQVDIRNIIIPKEEIELKIKKIDSSTKQSLQGVGIQLYKEDAGWVAIDDEDGSTYFAENYSNATTYTTGEDGKISIKDLTVGTYYIYENKTSPTYSLDHQRTKYPDSADPNSFAGKKEYSNMVYLGQIELKEEDKGKTFDNITYEQYSLNSKLTILKKDGTLENVPLSGTKIKIFGNSNASNGWIKYTNDDGYSFETYENATEFITDNSGIIELKNIPYGKYYIFETEAANKKYYNIKEQDGYHKTIDEQGNPIPGTNNFSENTDWVYLGTATIGESAEEIQFNAINKAYVSLKGKVWQDISIDKTISITGDKIYNSNSDDLISEIIVNLYNGKDERIASTKTNNNGEYEFRYKGEQNKTDEQIKDEDKLTYWELASCYVEFIYDNTKYIVIDPFVGEDTAINSKAKEESMTVEELDDNKLTGTKEDTKEDLPGKAITYKGGRNLTPKQIIENSQSQNKDFETTPLTGYYNENTYTIENINLGLVEKAPEYFNIGENLKYVKILLNGYTYTYNYDDPEIMESQLAPTVTKQTDDYKFYAKLYPTDVAYNAENKSEDLKVYAVYSVSVKNNTTTHEDDIYNEKKLYLKELNATYDKDRFVFSRDQIGNEQENKEFNLWDEKDGKLTFNVYDKDSVFAKGINELETKTTHIQFRLKNDIINRILTDPDSINNNKPATTAFAKGYHEYLRTDNVWVDNKNIIAFSGVKGTYDEVNGDGDKYYVHKSKEQDKESAGLYLTFELAEETRKISGIIFEDKDDKSDDSERIGNGKFDEGETKLKNVAVSLLNENGSVAKLYNREGTKATIKDAIIVSDDGTYELSGVVPGKYNLQFTYGNGTKVYTDINGNTIDEKTIATAKMDENNTPINTKLYKSTILTGNAKGEQYINKDNKDAWYQTWFINDIGKNNSVATDLDSIINSRIGRDPNINNLETELNHKYENEGNTNELIDAKSPKMDVKIEYTQEEINVYKDNKENNCSGLSFGIIERPHVNITLEKKIKNVKLTLQNGTTILNGDPGDKSVSQNLAKLTDSNAKVELDSNYLYGSNAIVTYTLSAHNESELDYPTDEYYKYGDIKDATPVTTTVTKIVDYLNNQNASYENKSVTTVDLTESEKKDYFTDDAINENKNYEQTVFTTTKALLPVAAVTEENLHLTCTDEYEFTVNNLLSTSDEILGWISYAEVIGINNITLTPQSVSKSGNYIVGDDRTYEADTSKATISINPSTGENRNLIIYSIIAGTLVIVALGVIIFKKNVIKKSS